MREPTEFETLHVLHSLWVKGILNVTEVMDILLTHYKLRLTSLTNGGITAETLDKNQKYKLQ